MADPIYPATDTTSAAAFTAATQPGTDLFAARIKHYAAVFGPVFEQLALTAEQLQGDSNAILLLPLEPCVLGRDHAWSKPDGRLLIVDHKPFDPNRALFEVRTRPFTRAEIDKAVEAMKDAGFNQPPRAADEGGGWRVLGSVKDLLPDSPITTEDEDTADYFAESLPDTGPASWDEIVAYVTAVLEHNTDVKNGHCLAVEPDTSHRKLARGMVYSIVHRLAGAGVLYRGPIKVEPDASVGSRPWYEDQMAQQNGAPLATGGWLNVSEVDNLTYGAQPPGPVIGPKSRVYVGKAEATLGILGLPISGTSAPTAMPENARYFVDGELRMGQVDPDDVYTPSDSPHLGDRVHYVSYGTPDGEYGKECRAAFVTDIREDGRRSLFVVGPTGSFFPPDVECQEPYAEGRFDMPGNLDGGTYHTYQH